MSHMALGDMAFSPPPPVFLFTNIVFLKHFSPSKVLPILTAPIREDTHKKKVVFFSDRTTKVLSPISLH